MAQTWLKHGSNEWLSVKPCIKQIVAIVADCRILNPPFANGNNRRILQPQFKQQMGLPSQLALAR